MEMLTVSQRCEVYMKPFTLSPGWGRWGGPLKDIKLGMWASLWRNAQQIANTLRKKSTRRLGCGERVSITFSVLSCFWTGGWVRLTLDFALEQRGANCQLWVMLWIAWSSCLYPAWLTGMAAGLWACARPPSVEPMAWLHGIWWCQAPGTWRQKQPSSIHIQALTAGRTCSHHPSDHLVREGPGKSSPEAIRTFPLPPPLWVLWDLCLLPFLQKGSKLRRMLFPGQVCTPSGETRPGLLLERTRETCLWSEIDKVPVLSLCGNFISLYLKTALKHTSAYNTSSLKHNVDSLLCKR